MKGISYEIDGLDPADLDSRYPVRLRFTSMTQHPDGTVVVRMAYVPGSEAFDDATVAIQRVRAGDSSVPAAALAVAASVLAVADEIRALRLAGARP